jgi:hypothetical protein
MPQEFPSIPYNGPAAARYGNYSKRYMVIHCTSNNAPPYNETQYAKNRTDGVGLHFCSDQFSVLQGLESWYGTGHVGSAQGNQYGISWEFVGYTSSSTAYYKACIDRAVASMRLPMNKHGIPYRWLSDSELRGGSARGLVTHEQCSQVLGGSDHNDPGPNFPRQYLIDALNGAHVTQPFDPFTDPTTRTQAQRIDALRSMLKKYKVNYTDTSWDANDPANIEETNKLAEVLEAILAKPGADVDEAALAAALAGNAAFVDALATAVATKLGPIPKISEIEEAAFRAVQRGEDE